MTQDLKARIAEWIAQHEADIAKCRAELRQADDYNEARGRRTTFAEEGCKTCDRIAVDLALLREVLSTEQTPDGEESQRPVAVNNGNTFVFCDYVGRGYGGCIRGAGHNGPHVFAQGDTLPQAPVLLERGETR